VASVQVDALSRLEEALAEIAEIPVTLERPADPAHGDYATNVALRLAGARRQPPLDIAGQIAASALERGLVEQAETAAPGFVNLHVSDGWLGEALAEILAAGDTFGAGSAATRQRIQVEMVSANPTGPITVASARNGAYGDSVARLLTYAGHDVEREYYYNDAGAQMDRFRASVEALRRGEEPPEDGYTGEYMTELAALVGDPVPVMLERIEQTLERFRIHFDTWARESEVEADIPEAIALLDTYEEDAAVWARTSAHGDDKDRVLVRSDGTPTYFAADAAYIRNKLARGFDHLIYVLGADHHGYVARLEALAEMLGHPRDALEVLVYQLVHLVERGQMKKMSKRRGDVVFLDELMDAIGVDAARWYLVSRGHDQTIEIDLDLAAERTQKNPVYYVQYAHARIAGILRNAAEEGRDVAARSDKLELAAPLEDVERELVKRLLEFPTLVAEATERRGPHALPTYAIRVADDFHRFYHHHRVLGSENEAFRLALSRATQLVVARSLDLVGVDAPDSM
jgi:arginyl-tRNA synthetase